MKEWVLAHNSVCSGAAYTNTSFEYESYNLEE